MVLRVHPDPSPADWVVGAAVDWAQLATFGPAGFAAYARLRFVPDPQGPGGPDEHDLPEDHPTDVVQIARALQVLAEFAAPQDCWFAIWDGWGDAALAPLGPARVHLPPTGHPLRSYVLLRGAIPTRAIDATTDDGAAPATDAGIDGRTNAGAVPTTDAEVDRGSGGVDAVADWVGYWADRQGGIPHPYPPAFVWPTDRSWVVARDVDPHWAGIGASAAAIAALLATPTLDVVPADPT